MYMLQNSIPNTQSHGQKCTPQLKAEETVRGRKHSPNLLQTTLLIPPIHILHITRVHLKPIPRSEPLKKLVVWQSRIQLILHTQRTRRLERPSPRRILHRISTSTEEDHGDIEAAQELDGGGVPVHRDVEAAKFVAREGVGAALENYGGGLISLEDGLNDLT